MASPIRLIVGLGNPGPDYEKTRHNAGAWFVEKLAKRENMVMRPEKKFYGLYGSFTHQHEKVHCLIPTTFMNCCGKSIAALMQFYQLTMDQVLIAHDELDLDVNDIRLKFDGGHGGHNGLRDIMDHCHTRAFLRCRIGIHHPGLKHLVTDYVLSPPSKTDRECIDHALDRALDILPALLEGDMAKAMQTLNT